MSDNTTIHRETFWMLVEEKIGAGWTREVWSSKVLPDCVVKVENAASRFQNVIEWETWQRVKDTEHAKWFAPCKWISPSGSVLVMERTRQPSPKQYPARMPAYLTDLKRTNYGILGNRLVCHDYGTNMLMENGMTSRMRKADWWDA